MAIAASIVILFVAKGSKSSWIECCASGWRDLVWDQDVFNSIVFQPMFSGIWTLFSVEKSKALEKFLAGTLGHIIVCRYK